MKLPNWQKDIFIIEEIRHVKRLAFEGNFLNHCVYTYLQDCLANRVHIFSYHNRKRKNSSYINH